MQRFQEVCESTLQVLFTCRIHLVIGGAQQTDRNRIIISRFEFLGLENLFSYIRQFQ